MRGGINGATTSSRLPPRTGRASQASGSSSRAHSMAAFRCGRVSGESSHEERVLFLILFAAAELVQHSLSLT